MSLDAGNLLLCLPVIDFSQFWDSFEERDLVWTALEPWFKTYGCTLYPQHPSHDGITIPQGSPLYELSKDPVESPHAYAQDGSPHGRMFLPQLAVYPAINNEHRDVVIKMLPFDDPERDIFKYIVAEPQRSNPLNLTVPVLQLLHYNEQYSFVIMPRWGNATSLRECGFDCLRTAFDFVLSLLKALMFLHNHLIAYRDFKLSNILVNAYSSDDYSFDYRPFFASKRAKFALCDFNLSVIFSPDTPAEARIRPALESE